VDFAPLVLSFQVSAVAMVLAGVIGVALAAWLANSRVPGRDLVDGLVTAPLVLPPTVLGYYVLVALGRKSFVGGIWEHAFGSPIVFTKTGAVVAATIGGLPVVVKSVRAALEATDPALSQVARTLGAGPLRAFLAVQLPLAFRGVLAALMIAFARSLGDFGVTLMVAGDIPGETQTASLAIYDAIQAHRESEALGMVLVLTSIAIVLLYAVNKLAGRRDGAF
jgi:molybdate transport system permease protein